MVNYLLLYHPSLVAFVLPSLLLLNVLLSLIIWGMCMTSLIRICGDWSCLKVPSPKPNPKKKLRSPPAESPSKFSRK